MRKGLLLPLLAVALGKSAMAQSGDLVLAYEPLDPGRHMDIVETASEQEELFNRRRLLFHDSEIQEIVDRVLSDVVPTAPDDYIRFRAHLIREPSPYIFSLADGQSYIHTGLLARLDNESQLAAVLAHEAHHIAAHDHIIATRSRRTKGELLGAIEFAAVGIRDNNLRATERNALWNNLRTQFTDEMEFNADIGSIALMARAGHPPVEALRALDQLISDPELSAARFVVSDAPVPVNVIGKDAPITEKLAARRTALQELVGAQPVGTVVTTAQAPASPAPRPLNLRRVIEMTIDDYIRLDRPGTAADLVDAMLAEQPDAFLHAAKGDAHAALGPRPRHEDLYEDAWYINGKRVELTRDEVIEKHMQTEEGQARLAENRATAIDAYNHSLELDPDSGRAHRGLGNLYFEQEDYKQAGRHFLKYLKLEPDAMDRSLIVEKLQHVRTELTSQQRTTE